MMPNGKQPIAVAVAAGRCRNTFHHWRPLSYNNTKIVKIKLQIDLIIEWHCFTFCLPHVYYTTEMWHSGLVKLIFNHCFRMWYQRLHPTCYRQFHTQQGSAHASLKIEDLNDWIIRFEWNQEEESSFQTIQRDQRWQRIPGIHYSTYFRQNLITQGSQSQKKLLNRLKQVQINFSSVF